MAAQVFRQLARSSAAASTWAKTCRTPAPLGLCRLPRRATPALRQRAFASAGVPADRQMKAVVLPEIGTPMRVETLSIARPKRGEVLVKNFAAGVCHTDLHAIEGHIGFPTPAVFGHEISGEIVEMGDGTGDTGLSVGDRVIGTFIMPCGSCGFCITSNEDICGSFFDYNRLKGVLYDGETRLFRGGLDAGATPVHMYSMAGFAEYSIVPVNAVYKLPQKLSEQQFIESSIIGCGLFTAYGAVKNGGDLKPGMNVVIIGCGGVGMNVIQLCRAFGANRIIGVDIDDERLEFARGMGATDVVNSRKLGGGDAELVKAIHEITGPSKNGADVAFEVLGRPETFNQAVLSVKDGGRAVMVGIAPVGTMAQVDITRTVRRKIEIHGSYGAKARVDTPILLDLLEKGLVRLDAVNKRYKGLETVQGAYEDLKAGKIIGKAIVEI